MRPLQLVCWVVGGLSMGCAPASMERVGLPKAGLYAPATVTPSYVPDRDVERVRTSASLDLDALLVYADAHAPTIARARAALGQGEAQMIEAKLGVPSNPSLGVGVGARVQGGVGVDVEVDLSQELEVSGQQRARRGAARATQASQRAALEAARWDVHVDVHRLHVALVLTRRRQRLARRFVALSDALREIARKRVEAEDLSSLAMLIADADAARAREVLIEWTRLERTLLVRMAARIGWPASQTLPAIQGDLGAVRRAPSAKALLSVMAQRHPSVRVQEIAVWAARARLTLAEREGAPKPSVGVSARRESSPSSGPQALVGMVTLEVPLAMWRWNQAGIARAEAQVRLADAERSIEMTRLRSQLLEAIITVNAAAERVALYETSVVPRLEKSLTLLRRAFELGEADIHQVSQTQRRLLEATRQYFKARSAYHEGVVRLEGIVGQDPWRTR